MDETTAVDSKIRDIGKENQKIIEFFLWRFIFHSSVSSVPFHLILAFFGHILDWDLVGNPFSFLSFSDHHLSRHIEKRDQPRDQHTSGKLTKTHRNAYSNKIDGMGSGTMVLDEFLKPLAVDPHLLLDLSREMRTTFERLCRDSGDQFLPTPISESIMRAGADRRGGR